jgi:hypothetical protein
MAQSCYSGRSFSPFVLRLRNRLPLDPAAPFPSVDFEELVRASWLRGLEGSRFVEVAGTDPAC